MTKDSVNSPSFPPLPTPRLLDLQSVDYMPQLLYSTEPPPLYGTQLLIKSLMTHERGVHVYVCYIDVDTD